MDALMPLVALIALVLCVWPARADSHSRTRDSLDEQGNT